MSRPSRRLSHINTSCSSPVGTTRSVQKSQVLFCGERYAVLHHMFNRSSLQHFGHRMHKRLVLINVFDPDLVYICALRVSMSFAWQQGYSVNSNVEFHGRVFAGIIRA